MCPERRQTMVYSATIIEQIDEHMKLSLNKQLRLEADPSLNRPAAPATLTEEYALSHPSLDCSFLFSRIFNIFDRLSCD
jgi:superfamily II DNA/RNA helicase